MRKDSSMTWRAAFTAAALCLVVSCVAARVLHTTTEAVNYNVQLGPGQ